MNNEYKYAGFWIRLFAAMIDFIFFGVFIIILLYAYYGDNYLQESKMLVHGFFDILVRYIMPMVVTIFFWVSMSATPGKMLLKLKVIDVESGQNPTLEQAFLRSMGYIVSMLTFLLGYIWIAFDEKKQGWHDKIAKTVVIQQIKN